MRKNLYVLNKFVLTVLTVATIVCGISASKKTTVEAATTNGVTERLAQFATAYPDGSYYNAVGKATDDAAKKKLSAVPSKTVGKVFIPAGKNLNDTEETCAAFATIVYYYVFGWSTGNFAIGKNADIVATYTSKSAFVAACKKGSILPGDELIINGGAHYAICYETYTNGNIKVYEGGKNQVSLKVQTNYWGKVGASKIVVKRAKNYNEIKNTSAEIQKINMKEGTYNLVNVGTNKVFTAAGTNVQTSVNLYESGNPNQCVSIKLAESKGYEILVGSLATSVYATSVKAGDKVVIQSQSDKGSRDTQHWEFEDTGNSHYIIRNAQHPELVLTAGSSGKITVEKYNGKANQIWALTSTSSFAEKCTKTACSKKFTVNKSGKYLKLLPCSSDTDIRSADIMALSVNTVFYAQYEIKSPTGYTWYDGYVITSAGNVCNKIDGYACETWLKSKK